MIGGVKSLDTRVGKYPEVLMNPTDSLRVWVIVWVWTLVVVVWMGMHGGCST